MHAKPVQCQPAVADHPKIGTLTILKEYPRDYILFCEACGTTFKSTRTALENRLGSDKPSCYHCELKAKALKRGQENARAEQQASENRQLLERLRRSDVFNTARGPGDQHPQPTKEARVDPVHALFKNGLVLDNRRKRD